MLCNIHFGYKQLTHKKTFTTVYNYNWIYIIVSEVGRKRARALWLTGSQDPGATLSPLPNPLQFSDN